MSVLSVRAVAKRFGERLVFHDVSFRLAHGDRVGLIGPNGVGKTTLLHIAAGLEAPDAGNAAIARGTRIGFLEQELLGAAEGTVAEHARGAATHLREIEAELRALEPELATGEAGVLERYADTQHRFEHAGGYDFDATVGRVLGGLGLAELSDRDVRTLSGGERTREEARARRAHRGARDGSAPWLATRGRPPRRRYGRERDAAGGRVRPPDRAHRLAPDRARRADRGGRSERRGEDDARPDDRRRPPGPGGLRQLRADGARRLPRTGAERARGRRDRARFAPRRQRPRRTA